MLFDDKQIIPVCISSLFRTEGSGYTSDGRFVSLSGIKILCTKDQKADVKELFRDTFDPLWIRARKYVDRTDGPCLAEICDYWPYLLSENEEYGIFIALNGLGLSCALGEWSHTGMLGESALVSTLDVIKKQYPSIKYYGFIHEEYYDKRCTEWNNYILEYNISKSQETYDFIGEYISWMFRCKHLVKMIKRELGYFLYDEEDYCELIDFYYCFKNHIDNESFEKAIDLLLLIAESHDKKRRKKDCGELLTIKLKNYIKQLENHEVVPRYCFLQGVNP